MTNPEIINSILKSGLHFQEKNSQELNFHDHIVAPSKEERKPPYTITETKSRFMMRNTAEGLYLTVQHFKRHYHTQKYHQENTIAVIKGDKKEMFKEGSIAWLNTYQGVRTTCSD